MFLGIIIGLFIFWLLLFFLYIKFASAEKNNERQLHKMLDEVTAQVKEKNEALKEEIEKKRKMEDELKNLKARLESQNKKMAAVAAQEAEIKKRIDKLNADIALKDKQLKDNFGFLEKEKNESRDLKEMLKKKDVEISSLNEAYSGLKEQYDDLEKELSAVNQDKDNKNKSLSLGTGPKSVMPTDKTISGDKTEPDNREIK